MTLHRREDDAVGNEAGPADRNQVLARYRRFMEIGKRHHQEILKIISRDALLHQARRLGLAHGKTLIHDDADELNYAFDLAIHTAAAGRSRAIDRYARSARLAAGSDEARVLEAMRAARFSILVIERRHAAAGLVAVDLFRRAKVWLVDIGLESSLPEGGVIATRVFMPEQFAMTAGVNVLFDLAMIEAIDAALPDRLRDDDLATVIDDRRFAEAIYRFALDDGTTDRVIYQDLPDDDRFANAAQPA